MGSGLRDPMGLTATWGAVVGSMRLFEVCLADSLSPMGLSKFRGRGSLENRGIPEDLSVGFEGRSILGSVMQNL